MKRFFIALVFSLFAVASFGFPEDNVFKDDQKEKVEMSVDMSESFNVNYTSVKPDVITSEFKMNSLEKDFILHSSFQKPFITKTFSPIIIDPGLYSCNDEKTENLKYLPADKTFHNSYKRAKDGLRKNLS